MKVTHINVEAGESRHRFLDGVWDVVKFEVKEDLMSPLFDLFHDGWAFRIEELHADFHEWLSASELIKEFECLFLALEVASDDYVFCHLIFFLQ